ncbi:hypothetical protein ACI2OX_05675 [Bacillus sp. N9]
MLKKANLWGSTKQMPKILCIAPTQSNFDDSITYYQLNYHLMGSEIADLLINQVNNETIDDVIIFKNNGISNLNDYSKQKSKSYLEFLTIPSPTTDAISKILPYFEKKTGIQVNLTIKPYEEIYQILSETKNIVSMTLFEWIWHGFLGLEKMYTSHLTT